MSVVEAVQRDIDRLSPDAGETSLAATALALAALIDGECGSPTSRAMVAKELRETMATLKAVAPPKKEADRSDELAERRRAARAERSAAS